jgi:hypothetical protein
MSVILPARFNSTRICSKQSFVCMRRRAPCRMCPSIRQKADSMKSSMVKKTLFLNQANIAKSMHYFNEKTETEAVNRALELATDEAEIISVHKTLRSKAPRFEQCLKPFPGAPKHPRPL